MIRSSLGNGLSRGAAIACLVAGACSPTVSGYERQ
jgi:hypothetical protein